MRSLEFSTHRHGEVIPALVNLQVGLGQHVVEVARPDDIPGYIKSLMYEPGYQSYV